MLSQTILDVAAVLVWPLVLSAVAWVIVINALAERDEISKVVDALIQQDSVQKEAAREDAPQHSKSSTGAIPGAVQSGNLGRIQIFLNSARHSAFQYIRGTWPRYQKKSFARH